MYARLLWDDERYARLGEPYLWRGDEPDWPPGFRNPGYPAVIPVWYKPRGGEKPVRMTRAWQYAERDQNETLEGVPTNAGHPYKVFVCAYCRYNDPLNPPYPYPDSQALARAEDIVFSGNYVEVLERKNGSARIAMLDNTGATPSRAEVNYIDTPTRVHRVSAIYRGGVHGWNDDYILLNRNPNDEAWVDESWLEMDVQLPNELPVLSNQDLINIYFKALREEYGVPRGQEYGYLRGAGMTFLAEPPENRQKIVEHIPD